MDGVTLPPRDDRARDHVAHRAVFLLVETLDRSLVPSFRIDPRQVDLVTGLLGQNFQKGALCAAVAVEKGVNCVEFVEVLGRARRELAGVETAQVVFGVDGGEAFLQLGVDELGQAKGSRAAPGIDPANLAGPIIDVLKEIAMDFPVAFGDDRRVVRKRQQPIGLRNPLISRAA